ncbi:MAG: hypothetical protein O2854_03210 [Chloroflexi bacterium]|nr:hypothetical protein [Chloroflexota bacterium]
MEESEASLRKDSNQPPSKLRLFYHFNSSLVPSAEQAIRRGWEVASVTAEANTAYVGPSLPKLLNEPSAFGQREIISAQSIFKLVELTFDEMQSNTTPQKWIRKVYGSSDIDFYVRRRLLVEIEQLIWVTSLITKAPLSKYSLVIFGSDWPNTHAWSSVIRVWRCPKIRLEIEKLLPKNLLFGLTKVQSYQNGDSSPLKIRLMMMVTISRMFLSALHKTRVRPKPLPNAKLIIRTYPTDIGVDSEGQKRLRNIDFIIDDKELVASDTAFWVEPNTPINRREWLLRRGYQLIIAENVKFTIRTLFERIVPLLVSFAILATKLKTEEFWFINDIKVLLRDFFMWNEICRRISPAAFLSYNDIGHLAVSRNLVMRKYGCRSVFYQHSSNVALDENDWLLNSAYSFLVFDTVVTWGAAHSRLFKRHNSSISTFWETGCLWSEHVRLVSSNPWKALETLEINEPKLIASLERYDKRVGVFDTSVSLVHTARDMAQLYADIICLAEKLTNVLFIYKPKNPLEHLLMTAGSLGNDVRQKLATMDNILLLPNSFETATVIGLSDLTINACFTSTAIETIGAGRRAIYYDSTNSFPQAFWFRIPGMVCTTVQELSLRVSQLLWELDDKSYLAYLRKYCYDIEGHFDGLAISRLRQHLSQAIHQ